MEGSFIFKYVLEAALVAHNRSEIMIIEGCQDYVAVNRERNADNIFYLDLFTQILCNPILEDTCLIPHMFRPKPLLNQECRYPEHPLIIVNNAHMIPAYILNMLQANVRGRLVLIVDPFDIDGISFRMYPFITDSMFKLTPMLAMARASYGVETRSVDRKSGGNITEAKITRRSIGKIDAKQYVTKEDELLDEIRHKQIHTPFKKNQKFLVNSDRIFSSEDNGIETKVSRNALLTLSNAFQVRRMKMRLWNSREYLHGDLSYLQEPDSCLIPVKPANIISINEAALHRFNTIHLIVSETNPLSSEERYAILKNANNVILSYI
jgi:hypothetical protein